VDGKITITLTFTEETSICLSFSSRFWMEFARGYGGLPWVEMSEERTAIVAENYSYLLDLLVQGRLYRLSRIHSRSGSSSRDWEEQARKKLMSKHFSWILDN